MMRLQIAAVVAVLIVAAGHDRFSAQASKLSPASVTFECSGPPVTSASPANPCSNGDAIAGDNLGPYLGEPTGGNNAAQGAYIDSSGDLYVVVREGSGRAVFFGFTPPNPGDIRTFTSIWSFHLQASLCGGYDGHNHTISLRSIAIGDTVNGWCDWNFYDTSSATDAYLWTVRFDPVHYPGTSYVSIARTAQAAWTIQAGGSAGSTAELIASTTSGKYVTFGEGFYQMPFGLSLIEQ